MTENSTSIINNSQRTDAPIPPVRIRSKEQLTPIVNQYIELYTKLYPPRIYRTGVKNAQSEELISDTKDPTQFKAVENMATVIRDATLTSPDVVVAAIFEMPPKVTVNISREADKIEREMIEPATDESGRPLPFIEVMAPNEDIELSKRETIIPPKTNSQTAKELDSLINACKSYLKAPLIREDGFGSSKDGHERRRLYEKGIKGALAYLGNGLSISPEKDWSNAFQRKWDNLRITKNRQTAILNNYDVVAAKMAKGKTLSLDLIDNIAPYVQGLERAMTISRQLYDRGRTAWSSRILTEVGRDLLKHFDAESEMAKEINFQRFTYFERDFLTTLHSYAYGPNATLSELRTMINKLNFVYKDRSYMRMMPLLQTLVQYSEPELKEVLRRISSLEDEQIEGNVHSKLDDVVNQAMKDESVETTTGPEGTIQEKAIIQSFIHSFQLAMAVPAPNNSMSRTDLDIEVLKATKIPAVFDDSSKDKVINALSRIAMEFYHDRLDEKSLTNKILFKHFTGEKLDFIKSPNE